MKNSLYKILLVSAAIIMSFSFSASAQIGKAKTKAACRIYADTENSSSVSGYVPVGAEVEVFEVVGEYLLIEYKENKGYILKKKTDMSEAVDEKAIAQVQSPVQTSTIDDLPQDRFSILAQKYGYTTAKALYEHKIWKGIDHNMVKDSWGKPLKVSMEIGSNTTIEKWTYRKSWLKFKDGILYEWGPNKK